VWARKRPVYLCIAAIAAIAAVGVACITWAYLHNTPVKQPASPVKTYKLTIKNPSTSSSNTYLLRAAETASDQARGLGGRKSMPADQGMIFIYTGNQQRCFWMKDMGFAIDMIWLDHAKAVTHVEHNVAPSTYPASFCHDGAYVIELPAGEAARNELTSGQTLTF
jgi:uncharacterized membrane protein (UPF0127 family)